MPIHTVSDQAISERDLTQEMEPLYTDDVMEGENSQKEIRNLEDTLYISRENESGIQKG